MPYFLLPTGHKVTNKVFFQLACTDLLYTSLYCTQFCAWCLVNYPIDRKPLIHSRGTINGSQKTYKVLTPSFESLQSPGKISIKTRFSQLQHYWSFGSDNCLLWWDVQCIAGYLSSTLAFTHLSLYPAPQPISRHCQMSPGWQNHSRLTTTSTQSRSQSLRQVRLRIDVLLSWIWCDP